MTGRNALQDGVNTKDNRIYTSGVLSNDGSNNVAIRYNEQELEYELAVNFRGHICEDNTTMDNLSSGGVFTGVWQDTLDYINIAVGINSDQNSATDGLNIQWSADSSTIHDTDVFTIIANKGKIFTFQPARRYVRVKYTNGVTATTSFNIETRLSRVMGKPSSHRIQDNIVAEDDAELVKSVLTGEDPDGVFQNVSTTVDGDLTISDNSNGLSIAQGNVTGVTYIHKFGNAPDFDTSDSFVTVWDGAEDNTSWESMSYNYSTSADIGQISSSINSDTQDMEIQGLDSNYDISIQTISLTGQTPAALTTNLIRIFRMKNVNSTDNAGHIFCYTNSASATTGIPDDANDIRAIMQPLNNQTLMSIYTIPNGKTGYLRGWYASAAGANKTSNYIIDVKVRPLGGAFQLKHRSAISDLGTSYIQHKYEEPERYNAKTDIEIKVAMQATGGTAASISAGFDIVLIDD